MWKLSKENAYPDIILHDCRIIKANLENSNLTIEFNDSGFWVTSKINNSDEMLRTDKSQITFENIDLDFISIYIFKKMFFGVIKKELFLSEFIDNINNGKWEFEFINETYGINNSVFIGQVWFSKKPYHYDCQIELSFDKMTYYWNKVYLDRKW